jgi:YVTN family beta-propeller protein
MIGCPNVGGAGLGLGAAKLAIASKPATQQRVKAMKARGLKRPDCEEGFFFMRFSFVSLQRRLSLTIRKLRSDRMLFFHITQNQPRKPAAQQCFFRVSAAGYVAVIDARSHELLSKIQLPTGSLPMGTAISSDGKELYVSTGRGNAIAIIDTAKNAVATTIPVGNRAWGIALDPTGSKLYTANGASNDVSVIDLKSRKELRRIKVRDGPWGIAIVSAAK